METDLRVGIDVSSTTLDVAWSDGRQEQVANHHALVEKLVLKMKEAGVSLVVFEATGGYERDLHCELSRAEVPAAMVNPRQVRDFAKAMGRLAKTDRIDAKTRVTSQCGCGLNPNQHPLRQRRNCRRWPVDGASCSR